MFLLRPTQKVKQNEETEEYVLNKRSQNLRKNLNEMGISNLPDEEFKVTIIKMPIKLGKRMD